VYSLAISWPTRNRVDFYGNKGSFHQPDDFADLKQVDMSSMDLVPVGGRSSDGIFPFFALTDRHDSLAIGIGWSGNWRATMRHMSGLLDVEIGLQRVGFELRPWEAVRLPSVLLARRPDASVDQARRAVRSHLTHHVMPKASDGGSPNFTAHSMMYDFLHGNPVMSEESELAALERAAAMGMETYWLDAGWYGETPDHTEQLGNWYVRRSDFPRGVRPISDRAHELGMKFIFWMEPERVQLSSEWGRAHPELLLHYPNDDNRDLWRSATLLNLGDPRAVDLAFTKISELITEFNADIFRQDMNTRPFDAWCHADAPNRVGISEIRYVEGLYALWDRILAAHPGILIDNCASGGRRIDLEMLRRSVPLWRSDYLMFKKPPGLDIVNQVQGWGLGHWVSEHTALIKTFDAYAVRSSLATGFMPYRALPSGESDPEYADLITAVAENKRLRPLLREERIGLIAPTFEKEAWMAYQHHRRADSRGFIVALRGPEAEADSVTLKPEYIDANARYRVTHWDDYVAASPVETAGVALNELVVKIAKKSSSVLIEYERIDG